MKPFRRGLLIGLVVPLICGYAAAFAWIWGEWVAKDSYYSHGPLLPLLAGFMLWSRRDGVVAAAATFDLRGWYLLGPGLLLHLAGAALMVDSLSAVSLWLSLPGAILLAQGAPRLRSVAAIVGLIVFAVPPPSIVTGQVVFGLKEVAVDLGMGLANLVGAGVTRIGANLHVPGDATSLVVADACGGLRSMVSLTTVGYVVAFCIGSGRGIVPWLVLACAVPVALLSNVVRIASMCLMSSWFGVEFGAGTGHDIANAVVWIGAIVVLLALDAWFAKRWGAQRE